MDSTLKIAYIKLLFASIILGTMGVCILQISLPSAQIGMLRWLFGAITLLAIIIIRKIKCSPKALLKYAPFLLLGGLVSGYNSVFVYEAFRNTTVSNTTLISYCGPLIAMLFSPIFFKEKLTANRIVAVFFAMLGLALINLTGSDNLGINPPRGIFFASLSALTYCSIIILNKFVKDIPGIYHTFILNIISCLVLIPYVLITSETNWVTPSFANGLFFVLIIGIVHAGLACYLYYSAMHALPAQSLALCSYLDPVFALFFAATILGERMGVIQWLGIAFILGGAIGGEIYNIYRQSRPHNISKL